MPSNVFGYPYPLDTDPVRAGAADIKALATFTEGRAGCFIDMAEQASIPTGSGSWYTYSLNTIVSERDTQNRLTPSGGGIAVASGWIDVLVQVKWNTAANGAGRRIVGWGPITGGPSFWSQSGGAVIPNAGSVQTHREIVRLAAGTTIFAQSYQDSGAVNNAGGARLVVRYLSQL